MALRKLTRDRVPAVQLPLDREVTKGWGGDANLSIVWCGSFNISDGTIDRKYLWSFASKALYYFYSSLNSTNDEGLFQQIPIPPKDEQFPYFF